MKKRVLSFLLAVCTAVSLLVLPAGAVPAARYSDVTDSGTATTAEVLRLMGVMDGYADGTFRANTQLNRAQFCKMATYAMNAQQKLGLYRTVTVFPDVKPSHWAAPYINLCSRTSVGGGSKEGEAVGQTVIAGFPDGRFHPERPVTLGQAVTILLRILGYQDSEIGGVWPDSFLATGAIAGLTKGMPTNGGAPLTRGQAARLFLNLLTAKTPGGGTLYSLSGEVELLGVDGGAGTMKVSGAEKPYPMVHPVSETSLVGMKGQVVLSGDKALTFLPDFGKGTGSSSGAIVLYEDESAAGLSELAGNTNYKIYKNGTPATVADLRKYDVATYYPDTNSIIVCDTRVSVYYESAEPSAAAPTKIQALQGTEFFVLPTAVQSVAALRPGDQITLLLTADGQIAGAVKAGTMGARSNALALVTPEGSVELFCGSGTIPLKVEAKEDQRGDVVRISSVKKDRVELTSASGGASGSLNVAERRVGRTPLAQSVVVYEEGQQTSLSQLTRSEVPQNQIRYARTNWAGQVDLIVLDRATDEFYGRVFWQIKPLSKDGKPIEIDGVQVTEDSMGVDTGAAKYGPFKTTYKVKTGDYVAAKLNRDKNGFSMVERLPKQANVSWDSWIGNGSVIIGGRSYEVYDTVQCYNAESQEWITLEQAKAYADTADLYVRDGVVRIIEVR